MYGATGQPGLLALPQTAHLHIGRRDLFLRAISSSRRLCCSIASSSAFRHWRNNCMTNSFFLPFPTNFFVNSSTSKSRADWKSVIFSSSKISVRSTRKSFGISLKWSLISSWLSFSVLVSLSGTFCFSLVAMVTLGSTLLRTSFSDATLKSLDGYVDGFSAIYN